MVQMVRGGEVLHRSIIRYGSGYFSEREGSDVEIGIIIRYNPTCPFYFKDINFLRY